MSLRVVPITLNVVRSFVSTHHRHSAPPHAYKFAVGLMLGDVMVGVASAGRPVSRHLDDGLSIEVTRTCTDGTRNANSKLYGAVWRAAKAMGYTRGITYTQEGEDGASLRAAGWVKVAELPAAPGWDRPARRRASNTGGVARARWEIKA